MNRLLIFLFIIGLVMGVEGVVSAETMPTNRVPNNTYVVNSADDTFDGLCDASHCSLSEAIFRANGVFGRDEIIFDFTTATTIVLNSPLPVITSPVDINGIPNTGSTCPSSVSTPANLMVTLDGANVFSGGSGLSLGAGSNGSTIRGLNIVRFEGSGIFISSGNNHIVCNHIGLPNADLGGYANLGIGIWVGGSGNRIGGLNHQDRNVIVGEGAINVTGDSTSVHNNYIGTTRDGTLGLGTVSATSVGIRISGSHTTIGAATAGNVIGGYATGIADQISVTTGNAVRNNMIGVDRTGTTPIPNGIGLSIFTGSALTVGGAADSGNVIAYNTEKGIYLQQSDDATISHNELYSNGDHGLHIDDANDAVIESNIIYDNALDGVRIESDSVNNALRSNLIYDNGGLGIELLGSSSIAGITPNDAEDDDSGANNLQNYPVLVSAKTNGQISGTFQRDPSNTFGYAVDVFRNDQCDDQSLAGQLHGEGEVLLTSFVIGLGTSTPELTFQHTLPLQPKGKFLTLTATDYLGNTSEFSNCIEITQDDFVVVDTGSGGDANLGDAICADSDGKCTLPAAIDEANELDDGPYRINFDLNTFINTITLADPLVATTPIILDASTNFISTCPSNGIHNSLSIQLDGSSLGATEDILTLDAGSDGSEVRGIAFFNGPANGLTVHSKDNVIACNLLGSELDGSVGGNGANGILVAGGGEIRIGLLPGATDFGDRNIIANNDGAGIQLTNGAINNHIGGNLIGFDLDGLVARANNIGIDVQDGSTGATIAFNTIGGSDLDGVQISNGSDNVTLQNNWIGYSPRQFQLVGNIRFGVRIENSSDAMLFDNMIVGNGNRGISLSNSADSTIRANHIGYFNGGSFGFGNDGSGIGIDNSDNVTIGGATPFDGNYITENTGSGIYLDTLVTNTTIQYNFIGTNDSLFEEGNSFDGIHLNRTVTGSTISNNTIAHNDRNGIRVDNTATGNDFSSNSIYANGSIGIDLGENGVTSNDVLGTPDDDNGANGLQNYPTITEADALGNTLKGAFISHPNTTFRVEFFASDDCDGNTIRDGKVFLGSTTITTAGSGKGVASLTSSVGFNVDDNITATATHIGGDGTSEFSACFTATNAPPTAVDLTEQSASLNKQAVLPIFFSCLAILLLAVWFRPKSPNTNSFLR